MKKRVANWDVKLREFARANIGRTFVWGDTDCVSLVRRALIVIYDEDILGPAVPGDWSTKTGALRAYTKIDSFHASITAIGFAEIPKSVFRDGDILVSPGERMENMAMMMGSRIVNCNHNTGQVEIKDVDLAREDLKAYRFYG